MPVKSERGAIFSQDLRVLWAVARAFTFSYLGPTSCPLPSLQELPLQASAWQGADVGGLVNDQSSLVPLIGTPCGSLLLTHAPCSPPGFLLPLPVEGAGRHSRKLSSSGYSGHDHGHSQASQYKRPRSIPRGRQRGPSVNFLHTQTISLPASQATAGFKELTHFLPVQSTPGVRWLDIQWLFLRYREPPRPAVCQ